MRKYRHALAALAATALPIGLTSADATFGDPATVRGTITYDHYAAGPSVDVDARVLGDLVAAGAWVTIGGRVAGDLASAGGDLRVSAEIDDDARLAGGRIRFDGDVRDHLVAVGPHVTLGPASTVGGPAWLTGGDITLSGRIRGPVRITADEVTLAGRIDGGVEVTASRLRVLPDAHLDGDLDYRARDPARIANGARIDGRIRFRGDESGPAPPARAADHGFSLGGLALFVASLTLIGALMRLALPGFTQVALRRTREQPLLALGLGALVALVTPVALLLLCLFVITIPLSLAGLALWPPLLLAGYLVSSLFIAEQAVRHLARSIRTGRWQRIAALAVTLTALGLLQQIPYLGILVLFSTLLVGTGAVALALGERYRTAPQAG